MAKKRRNADAGQTVTFKLNGWAASVPESWRFPFQRGMYGYGGSDGMWCCRLYFNEKGVQEPIPSSPDGSPAAGIKIGIGTPLITWGPFCSVLNGTFDVGGVRAGQALAFGNQQSGYESGQRWRRYGFVKELSDRAIRFEITKTTMDAVKEGELIRQRDGITRRVIKFGEEAPLIRQLATLAACWGGIEILPVAIDYMLEKGIGGASLDPAPGRQKQIGDQALENRERMTQEVKELQERLGSLQREMQKQGFHLDPDFLRRYAEDDAVMTEAFMLRQQITELQEMLIGMVTRHNECGTEMQWDGRMGPDPLGVVQRYLHRINRGDEG